jgi:hypothetical protein
MSKLLLLLLLLLRPLRCCLFVCLLPAACYTGSSKCSTHDGSRKIAAEPTRPLLVLTAAQRRYKRQHYHYMAPAHLLCFVSDTQAPQHACSCLCCTRCSICPAQRCIRARWRQAAVHRTSSCRCPRCSRCSVMRSCSACSRAWPAACNHHREHASSAED